MIDNLINSVMFVMVLYFANQTYFDGDIFLAYIFYGVLLSIGISIIEDLIKHIIDYKKKN